MTDSVKIAGAGLPRPYLFFEVVEQNVAEWARGRFCILTFQIRFKNHGSGPAIITFLDRQVYILKTLPPKGGRAVEEFHIDNVIAVDSEKLFESPPFVIIDGQRYQNVNKETHYELSEDIRRVYLVGAIFYWDIYFRSYTTAFCISFDFGLERIRSEGEADYNYQT